MLSVFHAGASMTMCPWLCCIKCLHAQPFGIPHPPTLEIWFLPFLWAHLPLARLAIMPFREPACSVPSRACMLDMKASTSILRAVTSLCWTWLPGDICGAQLSYVSIPFSLLSFSTLTGTLARERFVTQKGNTYVLAGLHV